MLLSYRLSSAVRVRAGFSSLAHQHCAQLHVLVRRHCPRQCAGLENAKSYLFVVMYQLSLVAIYPVYTHVFASLGSKYQTAFVLVLSVIKITSKNIISYVMINMHDMKPEFIIFNIEIFNALFIAMCMQSSSSVVNLVALMAVDFIQAWL